MNYIAERLILSDAPALATFVQDNHEGVAHDFPWLLQEAGSDELASAYIERTARDDTVYNYGVRHIRNTEAIVGLGMLKLASVIPLGEQACLMGVQFSGLFDEEHRSKGAGTDTIVQLTDFTLDLAIENGGSVFSFARVTNVASCALLTSVGLKPIGRAGDYEHLFNDGMHDDVQLYYVNAEAFRTQSTDC